MVSRVKPVYRIEIHRAGGSFESFALSDIQLLPGDVLQVEAIYGSETEVPSQ